MLYAVLYLVAMATGAYGQTLSAATCSNRQYVDIGGPGTNAMMAGLFPLRRSAYGDYGCGSVGNALFNMQEFEAARYAIGRINSVRYVPGVTLGMRAYDSCSSGQVALKSISEFFPGLSSSKPQCSTTQQIVPGVIGGHFSSVTKSVAEMLAGASVAQVAYSSTAADFSDVSRYPNLLRTDAPAAAVAEGVALLLQNLQWDYVALVFTDDTYGRSMKDLVLRETYKRGICISKVARLYMRNDPLASVADSLRPIVNSEVTGVVYAGSLSKASTMLQAVGSLDPVLAKKLQWVFTASDVTRPVTSDLLRGSLSFSRQSTFDAGFADYFSSLDPLTPQADNPWFQDWYMETNNCQLPGNRNPLYFNRVGCQVPARSQRRADFVQDESVEGVIKAVYVFANALRRAQRDKCRGAVQLFCSAFKDMSSTEFLGYVKGTGFTFSNTEGINSMNGVSVRFDANLDLQTYSGFNVINYRLQQGATAFEHAQVGIFSHTNGLVLNTTGIQMFGQDRRPAAPLSTLPISSCTSGNCSYCVLPMFDQSYFSTRDNGQILIGAIFPVHNSDPLQYTCRGLHVRGSIYALGYFYALQVASQKFPNLNLGGLFLDSCDRGEFIAGSLQGLLLDRQSVMDQNGRKVDPSKIFGFVDGSETKSAVSIADMLQPFGYPDVGSVATGTKLRAPAEYPFYATTVPSVREQTMSMVQFLLKTGLNYVQTIHAADEPGREAQMDFKFNANLYSLCVAASFEIGTDGSTIDILNKVKMTPAAKAIVIFGDFEDVRGVFEAIRATGASGQFVVFASKSWGENLLPSELDNAASGSFTMVLQTSPLAGFSTYLQGLTANVNIPFYAELYEKVFDCSLDAQNIRGFRRICDQSQRVNNNLLAYSRTVQNTVPFTVKAVELVAQALNDIVVDVCRTSSPCQDFYDRKDIREMVMLKIRSLQPSMSLAYTFEVLNYRPTTAQKFIPVATYDPVTRVTSLIPSNPIVFPNGGGVGSMIAQCTGFCQHCMYLLEKLPYLMSPGEITIGALVGMTKKGDSPFMCMAEAKAEDGFQYAAAIQYALEQINSGKSSVRLNGVKLGSIIMDDCDSAQRAFSILGGLYSNTFKPTGFDEDKVRGWLTYSSDSTEEGGKLLGKLNVPVISPFASAVEFRNAETYPSLYLTVPRLDKMISAMVQLIGALGFRYVQVLYSPTLFGRSGLNELEEAVKEEGICVINSLELRTNNQTLISQSITSNPSNVVIVLAEHSYYGEEINEIATSLLPDNYLFVTSGRMQITNQNETSIVTEEPNIPTFKTFLSKQENTFFRRYFEERFKCRLAQSVFSQYPNMCIGSTESAILGAPLDQSVLPTINAVNSLAHAIHKTLQQLCGLNYTSVCSMFELSKDTNSRILKNLEETNFDDISGKNFFFQNRESIQALAVHQRSGNSYVKVGDFSNGYLTLMDRDQQKREMLQSLVGTVSSCSSPCAKCIKKSLNFTFIPGDVYIGGMFDVHTRSINPFTCGRIKTLHGFQLLEAFQFAVHRVNQKVDKFANVLNGVTLGAIGMDSCESASRTGYQVSNIHNGMYTIKRDGYEVDPTDIKAYVAAYESDRTKYLARILSSLQLPQISYGATSIELADQERFPFFIRTVPTDDHQSDAILQFLDQQDLRYVQVLSSPTDYGQLGAEVFMERARAARICIAQSVVFPDNGTITRESANDAVTTLLDKPLANIVVIFADTGYLNDFLLAIKRNSEANGKFRFIGTITWSLNFRMDSSVLPQSLGAITLNLETGDMSEFDQYLATKTPATYRDNPWFDEYYEEIRNCYLRNPLGNIFQPRPPCSSDFKSVVQSSRYVQDPGVLHVVNSVYATAFGIDYALKQLCGMNYTGVCELFRSSTSTSELIFEGIEKSKFVDDTGAAFEFTERRDGNKGYSLYSIDESKANENGYVYTQIGSFRNQSGLTMKAYSPNWNGSCDRPRVCTECPSLRDSVSRFMEQAPGIDSNLPKVTLVGIFDLHTSRSNDEFLCGEMNYDTAFHNIMAFYYTLEKLVNNQPEFDAKIKINGLALDTCSSNIRVDSDLYGLVSGKGLCHITTDIGQRITMSNIAAVMTMGDDNTFAANRVIAPLRISLASPDAMSPSFQNLERYPYLVRAKPPSSDQIMAILALLREMGWNFISTVYSDNFYGENLHSTLVKYADGSSVTDAVCVGLSIAVREDSEQTFRSAVLRLDEQGKKGARVVVLLMTKQSTTMMIRAIRSLEPTTKFVLIGTESWGVDRDIIKNEEAFLAGAITLKRINPQVPSFKEYFAQLSYLDDRKSLPNDWFEEWYQHMHKCHLSVSMVSLRRLYQTPCQTNLVLNATLLKHDASVYHTILSTYAVAKALNNMAVNCTRPTLAECIELGGEAYRDKIFSAIKGVTWNKAGETMNLPSQNDYTFRFNNMRYGNTGFQLNVVTYGEIGRLVYKEMGLWHSSLTLGDITYFSGMESMCLEKNGCSCAAFGVVAAQTDSALESLGILPRNYYDLETTSYSNGTVAYARRFAWPIWAIVVGILTALGIFVCLVLFILLLCCYPVKSGTTILGFLLLVGILGIYAINFAFFLPASAVTCGIRRFLMGIVYAICFAALLVKAADIWRYSEFDTNPKKYKGITSAAALLLMALGLIFIQIIIPVMWLLVEQPTAFLLGDGIIPHDFWWCGPPLFYDVSLVLSFIYVILLVFLTIIFAVLAWYNINNHYESRWILGVSICTAGIFMVWMLVSTMAAAPYRDATVAIANWLNATILLICLPLRKTYILFKFLREGSEDDLSEKDDINMYGTEFNNHAFEPDDYNYGSKSTFTGHGKTVYTSQGGEVLMQEAPTQQISSTAMLAMSVNEMRESSAREIGEQTASMNIEEDTGKMDLVVESSGSAAVAAEAPPMEGDGMAVLQLNQGAGESTHTEMHHSVRQEEYVTYKTEYEYEKEDPQVEMTQNEGPDTVIITETVSSGSESDSDSDSTNSDGRSETGELNQGDTTLSRTTPHKRSAKKTYSYEVTHETHDTEMYSSDVE